MHLAAATVGVPLWGAALFFTALLAVAGAAQAWRVSRSARRRRAGGIEREAGWFRAAAHTGRTPAPYVCAAVREGGAIVEVWAAARPDTPLPPPRDARPFAREDLEKPIDEAISLGLAREEADRLLRRVVTSAGGT